MTALSRRYFRCQFCGLEAMILPASRIVAHVEPECAAYSALCDVVEALERGDVGGSLSCDGSTVQQWLEGGAPS